MGNLQKIEIQGSKITPAFFPFIVQMAHQNLKHIKVNDDQPNRKQVWTEQVRKLRALGMDAVQGHVHDEADALRANPELIENIMHDVSDQ